MADTEGQGTAETAQWRREREVGLAWLCVYAVATGGAVGLAAVAFKGFLAFVFHIGFHGEIAFGFTRDSFTGLSPLGPWVIGLPVVGGLAATWLVQRWAPEIAGSGVPQVLQAIFYDHGRIRWRVAPLKTLAAALTMGTGASVGREGPMIQVGAALGALLGEVRRLRTWQRMALLTAGGGAAVAATFNTPLGGALFAFELLMPEISARTFLPLVLATGTATYVGRLFFGTQPLFLIDIGGLPVDHTTVGYLAVIAGFGVICGLLSLIFIHGLAWTGAWLQRLMPNPYWRQVAGLLAVGVLIYAMGQVFGRYAIQGPGTGAVQAFFDGFPGIVWGMIVIIAIKFIATMLSLGSGSVGGIFSPVLVLGAGFGMAIGLVVETLFPGLFAAAATEFALLGMAGAVGAISGAAMTGIVMVFEMSQDYALIVPLMLVTGLAFGIRRSFLTENAYTIQLSGRGFYVPEEKHTNRFLVRHAEDYMDRDIVWLPASMTLKQALDQLHSDDASEHLPHHIVVTRGRHIHGTLALQALWDKIDNVTTTATLGELSDSHFVLARVDDRLEEILNRLAHHPDSARAIVVQKTPHIPRARDVLGVIDQTAIAQAVLDDQQG